MELQFLTPLNIKSLYVRSGTRNMKKDANNKKINEAYCFCRCKCISGRIVTKGVPLGLDSLEIIELAKNNEIFFFTSSSILLKVIHFLEKAATTNSKIILTVKNLFSFTTIVSPSNSTVINALDANFSNIKDGIQ